MGNWSGASRLDRSIYGAYLQAVSSAEHYIYIENQYLSSNVAGGGVENIVMRRILERLQEKIRAKQTFRVIIVIPQPEENGDSAMELLRWQYQTINRGGTSVIEQLSMEFPNVNLEDYISFFFLRQYAFLNGKPVTEKVFTHSKLMIVDDRTALVSSANFVCRIVSLYLYWRSSVHRTIAAFSGTATPSSASRSRTKILLISR